MESAREVAIFSKLLKTSNRSCCFSASCSFNFPLGCFPSSSIAKKFRTHSNTQKGKDFKIGKVL